MNDTKWIMKENNTSNDNLKSLDIDNDILNILLNRKIDSPDKIKSFLNPSVDNISNPFLLSGIDKAVKRLQLAIKNKEQIWIYGDYDVDGITSTSVCYHALKRFSNNINYYIPLRDEGYGLNKEALSYIKKEGGSVIITVDCGITSVDEINYANELGLDVIITDHHDIGDEIPAAHAVINPKRDDNEFQFRYLAGVGTAFMLMYALYIDEEFDDEILHLLDLVAIGTVADIVPLTDENRIFVRYGLNLLRYTDNIGLRTLLPMIFENYREKEYNSYDIGFVIAPIFNAAGRLEDAKMAVELLTTNSETEAKAIALKLIEQNKERKDIQKKIQEDVENQIEEKELFQKNAIIAYSENFHHGVIGIVASKIVDKYYKPTIIMEVKKEENMAVASCRSIDNFNMMDALNSMGDIFLKYGGHAGAAGFSIPIENIPVLEEKLEEYTGKVLNSSDFQKPVKIDKEIIFNRISFEFFSKLEELKPFGFANPNPVFVIRNLKLYNTRLIGKDKTHLMFDVSKSGITIKNCVWFSNGHNYDELCNLDEVDVAFKLKMEIYKDKHYTKIYVEDVKESSSTENILKNKVDLFDTQFPLNSVFYTRTPLEKNTDLNLNYEADYVAVMNGRRNLGFLNSQLAELLKELHKEHGFNFSVKIKEISKKEQNYNVFIELKRDYTFDSYAFKKNKVFKEIKEFLIGESDYNSIQKNVLASLFHKKQNTLLISEKERGVNTIFLTIGLYNSYMNEKKALYITNNKVSDFIQNYFDISDKFIDGYDYYIFDNITPNFSLENKGNILVFNEEDKNLDDFTKIKDNYEIPNNIKIVSEKYLVSNFNHKDLFYTKKISTQERLSIIKQINSNKKIYATKDILAIL